MPSKTSLNYKSEEELHGTSRWLKDLQEYLPEIVYGSMDGIVTTFAVVAGAAGANLRIEIVLILGIANLFADGLSMSIGSYLSKKTERDNYKRHYKIEEWEIEHLPDIERREIEDIYRAKGFDGDELKMVVNRITSNKKVWLETMMIDELGLMDDSKSPFKNGLFTLLSFIIAGAIPLIAYVVTLLNSSDADPFFISSLFTAMAFIVIGLSKNLVTKSGWVRSVMETLALGSVAASVAYVLGAFLERLLM
jgi:vacuolar iron transporter family protein